METKWIPIIEKRPEKSGIYLISGKAVIYDEIYNKNVTIRRTGTAEYMRANDSPFWVVREWHQDLNPFRFRNFDNVILTAWMPLLEPYDDGDD